MHWLKKTSYPKNYNTKLGEYPPMVSLLNKSSFFSPALGVTKFKNARGTIFGHTVVLLKSGLGGQQTGLRVCVPLETLCDWI
jgi:hypothetical protein